VVSADRKVRLWTAELPERQSSDCTSVGDEAVAEQRAQVGADALGFRAIPPAALAAIGVADRAAPAPIGLRGALQRRVAGFAQDNACLTPM
jgi:hypothetical protein